MNTQERDTWKPLAPMGKGRERDRERERERDQEINKQVSKENSILFTTIIAKNTSTDFQKGGKYDTL